MRLPAALAALALAAAPRPAAAEPLVAGVAEPVTAMDPHYLNSPSNKNVLCNIFDALTDNDAGLGVVPSLALSWRLVDPETWEFNLRPGVVFHDGGPFTAEDARAAFARAPKVPNAPAPFTTYIRQVKAMTVVDPLTIRFHTQGLDPILPNEAVQIRIMPARFEAAATDAFNSGTAAIGTGPLRLVSFDQGAKIETARHDADWRPRIPWTKATYRFVPDGAARAAALLAGDVQLIDNVPSDALAKLRADPAIRVATAEIGLRYIFLALDQSRDGPTPHVQGPNGETLDKNPLADRRVREALSIAIDRHAIADRIMEGASTPTGQMMPKGGPGHAEDIPVPRFDPDRARKLLAEAGYPNGLRIAIHSTKGRYVNDTRVVQAIAQMWQRIGVRATIDLQPWSSYASRVHRREYSVMIGAVAAVTGEVSQVLRSAMGTYDPPKGWGGFNWGRYSNPELDAGLDRAQAVANDAARAGMLRDLARIGAADVANIPLHFQQPTWAMRRSVAYAGRSDDQTRAAEIAPAR